MVRLWNHGHGLSVLAQRFDLARKRCIDVVHLRPVWFVDCFEREAKGRCDEILCLDIGVLGQNVVRFLHADAGRFGCPRRMRPMIAVSSSKLCVAGDVPLGVAVDQVEEVHCPSCGGRPCPSSGLRSRLAV